jgi:hypothetical protein
MVQECCCAASACACAGPSAVGFVASQAVSAHPQLAAVVAEPPVTEAFPADIEEEANSYFQHIYTAQQSIEEVGAPIAGGWVGWLAAR